MLINIDDDQLLSFHHDAKQTTICNCLIIISVIF